MSTVQRKLDSAKSGLETTRLAFEMIAAQVDTFDRERRERILSKPEIEKRLDKLLDGIRGLCTGHDQMVCNTIERTR